MRIGSKLAAVLALLAVAGAAPEQGGKTGTAAKVRRTPPAGVMKPKDTTDPNMPVLKPHSPTDSGAVIKPDAVPGGTAAVPR